MLRQAFEESFQVKEIQRNVNGEREGSEVGLRSPVIVSARSEAPTSVALSTKGTSARRISMRLRRLTGELTGGDVDRKGAERRAQPENFDWAEELERLRRATNSRRRDDAWLVGGSSRMLLRLSGQGRLVAGVKLAAGA